MVVTNLSKKKKLILYFYLASYSSNGRTLALNNHIPPMDALLFPDFKNLGKEVLPLAEGFKHINWRNNN